MTPEQIERFWARKRDSMTREEWKAYKETEEYLMNFCQMHLYDKTKCEQEWLKLGELRKRERPEEYAAIMEVIKAGDEDLLIQKIWDEFDANEPHS